MRLGVMGGTFDPVHLAHLVMAERAREVLGLEAVLWVPARHPPHKQGVVHSAAEHRCAMVELAVADNPTFRVSRVEMERPGPSYSLDTVRALQAQYPHAEWFFLTGLDAVLEIGTWHRPGELLRACRVVAASRPGYDPRQLAMALPAEWVARIELLATPLLEISGTEIRRRVEEGHSIRYLVPEPVRGYIHSHGLYRQASRLPARSPQG